MSKVLQQVDHIVLECVDAPEEVHDRLYELFKRYDDMFFRDLVEARIRPNPWWYLDTEIEEKLPERPTFVPDYDVVALAKQFPDHAARMPEIVARLEAARKAYKPDALDEDTKPYKTYAEIIEAKLTAEAEAEEAEVADVTSGPWTEYGMTRAAYEKEQDEPYPVLKYRQAQPGPVWNNNVMYGVAGEIIKKAAEFCESHPAGMYLDLLVAMGNIFGRQPRFRISEDRHYANEFVARVGLTSTARKGTGQSMVNAIIQKLDTTWSKRIMSGFGSAQAIIHSLRDDFVQPVRDKKAGFKEILVPGISDKRLFIRETELAGVFKLASMKDSQVDVVLRAGWDGTPLKNIVKGKSIDGISNSTQCEEPHISISGDTTRNELIKTLPEGSDSNGFGNRFLYCYVYRTQICSNGSPEFDWSNEIIRLNDAIAFAKTVQYVPLSESARKMCNRMYEEMERTRPNNRVGSMTARGPAHVRRLALILALLDLSPEVDCEHIHAARKIWDYCEDSARYIFGGYTKAQQRIIQFVAARGTVTVAQIRDELFHRNEKAQWIRVQIDELIREGYLALVAERLQLGKRPA